MDELIRKRDAIKEISVFYGLCSVSESEISEAYAAGLSRAIKEIRALSAVDAEPVRHGRWEWYEEWIPSTTDHYAECIDCGWRCSECKHVLEDMVGGYWDDPDKKPELNYCPDCGAKMDAEVEG